jgi:H+/Cl- antiporter ClcA
MTQLMNVEADLPRVTQRDRSYVDWAAVTGGALVAVVLFTTLTAFGSALGLSLTSAQPGQDISSKLAAIAIALWTAWTVALSFAAGGYIVGRLRHKIPDATEHEVRMRDGANGLID